MVPSITIGEARDRHLILNNPWFSVDFSEAMRGGIAGVASVMFPIPCNDL